VRRRKMKRKKEKRRKEGEGNAEGKAAHRQRINQPTGEWKIIWEWA
jgi:hypothetical protein